MDPNACLQRLADARRHQDQLDAYHDLVSWLERGGFAPDWQKLPEAARTFRVFAISYSPGLQKRLTDAGKWPA